MASRLLLVVFSTVLILMELPVAPALRCYECDSIKDVNCTATNALQPTVCKADDDVCTKSVVQTGVPSRAGTGGNSLGYTIVSRKCGRSSAVFNNVNVGECTRTVTGDGGVSTFCVCATHNCNRAGTIGRATALLGVAVGLAVVVAANA